jgi:hypothetical protein
MNVQPDRFTVFSAGLGEHPTVDGPGQSRQDHEQIADYESHVQQLPELSMAEDNQYTCDRKHRTHCLPGRDPGVKKKFSYQQHPDRNSCRHQGDIDRGRCLQGKILKRVINAHAQQTEPNITPTVTP